MHGSPVLQVPVGITVLATVSGGEVGGEQLSVDTIGFTWFIFTEQSEQVLVSFVPSPLAVIPTLRDWCSSSPQGLSLFEKRFLVAIRAKYKTLCRCKQLVPIGQRF